MFLPLHDQNPVRHIKFAYVNYSIIALTIAVFAVQVALPQDQFDSVAVAFGFIPAVVYGYVGDPAPWLPDSANFLTYAFLHADWLHLLSNMLFLWIFGDNIEDALGHVRYVLFYVVCAALAAGAHALVDTASTAPLVGASGAVAGVMGAYVLLFPHARLFVLARIVIPIPLPVPAYWMLGFWILSQLFYVFIGSEELIAWWAHIGGFIAGAILVLFMRRPQFELFGGRS